jgi:NTE family protein
MANNSCISEQSLNDELDIIFNQYANRNKLTSNKKTILVLSGGGIKGISQLGALSVLHENNMLSDITTYVGTSVGSMIVFFLYIGYSVPELYSVIERIDFSKMKCVSFSNLLMQYGLDDGKKIELVLCKLCAAKNVDTNITFKEMFDITNKKLIITASCINDKKTHYFSYTDTPDVSILSAIRMSMSIPIYFTPVSYNNKMFIDGGCIDNYPINLFKDNLDNVIGIYIENIRENISDISNIEDYLYHMMQCLVEGHSVNCIKGYEHATIKISLKNISAIDFNIDNATKKKLFDIGYNAALSYL